MKYCIHSKSDEKSEIAQDKLVQLLNREQYIYDDYQPEIVFIIGGDGTVLHAIHRFIDQLESIKFVCIHTGTLGFFSDYTVLEIEQLIEDLKLPCEIKKHPLLISKVYDFKNEIIFEKYGFNEIRIEHLEHTLKLEVYLNEKYLEKFRGNGLCVSTQAGSSAYNRSIGGAVIDETLSALQLTEVAGIHHQHFRSLHSPLLLNPETQISILGENIVGARLLFDHQHIVLDEVKKIEITTSTKYVKFAHFNNRSYYDRLRTLF